MLDTNILVSMIFFPNEQINTLIKILSTEYQVVVCDYVINELRLVVKRKFSSRWKKLNYFFLKYPFNIVFVQLDADFSDFPQVRDVKDIPILATAILEDIDVFITGDKDFLALEDVKKPRIMIMNAFLENLI